MPNLPKREHKIKVQVKRTEIYNNYKELFGGKLSRNLFKLILNDFFLDVRTEIIMHNFIYKMPYRLGELCVKKFKKKIRLDKNGMLIKMKLDYNKCWKLWRQEYPGLTDVEITKIKGKPRIFITNEHSNNWTYRFKWVKKSSKAINHTLYKFRPVRYANRQLAHLIQTVPGLDFNTFN